MREACPRLLSRTFPLADERGSATTGKLWVRRCAAGSVGPDLGVDVDVLGWQWVSEGSWGFDVHEYVYFRASVRATLHVSTESERGHAKLRVQSSSTPDVTVRELGRVSARAEGPAAGLLGVALGVLGKGPTALATSALRARVAELIRAQATDGLEIALDEVPSPGAPESAQGALLRETEALSPGGALISGSYPSSSPTTLAFDVQGNGTALARAVCIDDALPLVDAVVGGNPVSPPPHPSDVFSLHGRGEISIDARPCPWVLVTGVSSDAPVHLTLELRRGSPPLSHVALRWVQVTLLAYDVDRPGADLLAFRIQGDRGSSSFGRPLTRLQSPSVWLVAGPVEVASGTPVSLEVRSERPRAPSLWNARVTYDEVLLGRARIAPAPSRPHEERRVTLEGTDGRIGWADVALDVVEVE